jgi:SH3 domain protein
MVLTICLFWPGVLLADQIYVADVQDITLRSGPSMDNKPILMIKSGLKVDKIKEEGEWAYVRTDTGKEGWVLKRFLSTDTPLKVQFDQYKTQNAEMLEKAGQIQGIISKYEDQIKDLQKNLTSEQTDNTKLKKDYDTLSQANANVTELAKKHQELRANFDSLKQDADRFKRENETLRDLSDVKWFLSGAGVFFGGWVLGYMLGRSSRKKTNRMYL